METSIGKKSATSVSCVIGLFILGARRVIVSQIRSLTWLCYHGLVHQLSYWPFLFMGLVFMRFPTIQKEVKNYG